ncbi:MAG: sigma 54-interacting transcriptional regulator [candidate division NC10 bacterium]|nr:sigma 54-interacting transcriptional regulator [candidate division NC10 bacterium]
MSEEPLEAGFAILWARRAYWLDSIDNRDPNSNKMERATKKLKDSLIFAKYVLASPGMINILREVTKMNPRYQPGNPLPTVLVFGGPGSGKEKIARLIPLFSDDYFDSDVTVVNLAALRPETAVVPLLTGLSLESNWGELSVRGILQKAKERDPSTKKGNLPVLILDELNSLDLESQGVLLRIIENGELQALGSPSSETVEFLIIGIINESPEELTQELVMANVSRARHLFGEIANALIGSILLRAKRLRPDLYYRLRRGGEITLPSLNARREDIPILFYHFLTAEFSELQPDMAAKISVDLGVFDFLLSREIDWSGNVRQLQMFAKKCCKHILSRHGGLLGEPRVRRSDTETVAKNSGLLV